MKRAYTMTWGAQLLGPGVRFRLWAPAARTVSVVMLDGGERIAPMRRLEGGWFERIDGDAHAGARYLYEIDGELRVADPASRFAPEGPEQASEVVDPAGFDWPDGPFTPPPYHETSIYELHVGTFTSEGTYAAAAHHLDHLVELGINAVELMPLSQAPGSRNWGYDGVLHYAPPHTYGRPDDLKRFIVAAHARGLAVLLDVVYNHFGPQGNNLSRYAPQFFSSRLTTPWGAGIDYASPGNDPVRRYAIENACYWLTEYQFDGLRLDAVPMIFDTRPRHIVHELLDEAKRTAGRRVYLIAEDVKNEVTALVQPFDGRWSDDAHHALHVAITGERSEYFQAFANAPIEKLSRALTSEGTHRVDYLQNHDQIGNRPFGERITALASAQAVRAAVAVLLLAPPVPLLFMGEEWGASAPFLFFCDFEPNLAKRVTEGRRREFAGLAEFDSPAARMAIPDPSAAETFQKSKLQWQEIERPEHRASLEFYRDLLHIRREAIAPRLAGISRESGRFHTVGKAGLRASWRLADNVTLLLDANLSSRELPGFGQAPQGRVIFTTHGERFPNGTAPAWGVRWSFRE
ncbi:MAG: alpha-amylase family glycosyl hydrolase [Vulcanimicrobiaceae bacterium]